MTFRTDKEYGFIHRDDANALKGAADLLSAAIQVNNLFAIETDGGDYVKVNLVVPKEEVVKAIKILTDFDKQCLKNKKLSFK